MPTNLARSAPIAGQSTAQPTIVLKLGGSVLASERAVTQALHECYRWSRDGYRVCVVVSAIGDSTDRLYQTAARYGHAPSPFAVAALVATGEITSAAHCWLAADRAGLDAVALDPRDIQLRVRGHAEDAEPVSLDADVLRKRLAEHALVIVPGFVGIDSSNRLALLGRGGSDLTAILIAHALGARCRLIKDVPGLFERDPARPDPLGRPSARRYATVSFADAERLDGQILQRKALRYATERGASFEVSGLGEVDATLVGTQRTSFAIEGSSSLCRVALLGFGVVGRGIYQHLSEDRRRFALIGLAVRHPKRHADAIHPRFLRTDALALAKSEEADCVIETIGGIDLAYECVHAALARGADVITANKSLLAVYGEELRTLARQKGSSLRYSAAVGGAAPFLERVTQLADEGITRLEGVLNGTTNFIIGRCAQGESFHDALREAQALGFAEGDPTSDLEGIDATEKLILLCRAAFGREPDQLTRVGLNEETTLTPATKFVAQAWLEGERLRARVAPVELDESDPLRGANDEWNALRIVRASGANDVVRGKGAGRWPTAEAIYADCLDLWRERSIESAERNAEVQYA